MFTANSSDLFWMNEALRLAKLASQLNEVPVGAVVVRSGQIIGRGFNSPISRTNPLAHAELLALQEAARTTGNYRLIDCELFVTLEPCAMCAGALIHSRIKRLIFGAREPKAGAICSQLEFLSMPFLNHQVDVTGNILQEECSWIISEFFTRRRREKTAAKAIRSDSCGRSHP